MWDSLSQPWRVCVELAWEAYCQGSNPIGAAIFDANGALLSTGRNRLHEEPVAGQQQIAGGPLAHAEVNALLALDFGAIDKYSCRLYTTVEPCPLCVGAICMAGLKEIHYASRDPWAGAVNLLGATPYMRWKSIRAFSPQEGVFEDAMFCLRVDFHVRRAHPRFGEVLAAWEQAVPGSIATARAAHADEVVDDMRRAGWTAEAVFDELCEYIRRALP